jgi:hypothetical protein
MTIRSIETTDLVELALWCRDYHRYNKYPCSFDKRFAIGFYQIYQGIVWDGLNRYESFAAGAIHFLITLEALDLSTVDIPRNLLSEDSAYINWQTLMLHLSRAQQHVLYRYQLEIKKGTSRSTRFNPELLAKDLSFAIDALICAIPCDSRAQAIFDATEIMTRRL